MNTAFVVIGINHFEDITHPFIDSLWKHNNQPFITVVDNYSDVPYNHDRYHMIRTNERYSFPRAINFALDYTPYWDRIAVFNNDCLCEGAIVDAIANADENTFYGSEQNADNLVYSAWMVFGRKIWETVGRFDEKMSAGWEDFDYQLRCKKAGFKVDVLKLPVRHLDKHTRFEEAAYNKRWNETRIYFSEKHGVMTKEWLL